MKFKSLLLMVSALLISSCNEENTTILPSSDESSSNEIVASSSGVITSGDASSSSKEEMPLTYVEKSVVDFINYRYYRDVIDVVEPIRDLGDIAPENVLVEDVTWMFLPSVTIWFSPDDVKEDIVKIFEKYDWSITDDGDYGYAFVDKETLLYINCQFYSNETSSKDGTYITVFSYLDVTSSNDQNYAEELYIGDTNTFDLSAKDYELKNGYNYSKIEGKDFVINIRSNNYFWYVKTEEYEFFEIIGSCYFTIVAKNDKSISKVHLKWYDETLTYYYDEHTSITLKKPLSGDFSCKGGYFENIDTIAFSNDGKNVEVNKAFETYNYGLVGFTIDFVE